MCVSECVHEHRRKHICTSVKDQGDLFMLSVVHSPYTFHCIILLEKSLFPSSTSCLRSGYCFFSFRCLWIYKPGRRDLN